MAVLEKQEGKDRPQYRIELGEREGYRYVPKADVKAALLLFGLGESKQMVDAVYIAKDLSKAIGVLQVKKEEDHLIGNPIFQGVLGAEAMAQTWILWKMFAGQMNDRQTARFKGLDKVRFRHALYPGAVVNIAITNLPDPDKAYGQILLGKTVLTEAELEAVVIEKDQAEDNAKRRKKIQESTKPLFPFQE